MPGPFFAANQFGGPNFYALELFIHHVLNFPISSLTQSHIDEALKELGGDVQRMVMGHTPQFRINAALKGKAWRVDVGASKGVMSGTPEVLEIIHGGEDEDDVVKILTMSGEAICSSERQVMSVANLL
uniref:Calcineurin-like phosphoesterase domain-containing protein n=1 Tax=Ditylum brightwellii TaxID=49249 RepID=A0A7S4VAR2_9STRA|mmetsp:Transcript_25715/g.38643  ORF Transcript_25715/g.38643 Transcript_25715/m.38643 type:complete len:128 (-) Transcript_25715:309-692(-)